MRDRNTGNGPGARAAALPTAAFRVAHAADAGHLPDVACSMRRPLSVSGRC